MDSQSSSFVVKPLGFTTLQEGGTDPDLDIVFVHGLNGKPDKSWTYRDIPSEQKTENPKKSRLKALFKKKTKHAVSSKDNPIDKAGVFWPKDLLSQADWCQTARILTYGYDSDVIKLVDTTNFTTITAHGETLLNGLARARIDDRRRPLMFIVHSLGGLVVKSALNQSLINPALDLRALVESTFSIIFFGTPHRGSQYADFGITVIKAASVLTGRPYNDRIVKNLTANTEVLTQLRKTFDSSTLEMMAQRSRFESSTFQESRGFSAVAGFRGKASTPST
ncbi:hypothetical protein F5X99DRAFT_430347 [Biscogniauxia marginata]|nr:hypothetical protein F5X99DRAFT_430347 [Biscogniauxia marginata]